MRLHPNEELLRREYEARAGRDDRALAEVFAQDVVWHVSGRNAIAGEYRGIDQVMEYVRRRRELAEGTFEITVHDVLANDEYGLVIATGRATRGGRPLSGGPTGCIGSVTASSRSAGSSPRTSTSSTRSGASRPAGLTDLPRHELRSSFSR